MRIKSLTSGDALRIIKLCYDVYRNKGIMTLSQQKVQRHLISKYYTPLKRDGYIYHEMDLNAPRNPFISIGLCQRVAVTHVQKDCPDVSESTLITTYGDDFGVVSLCCTCDTNFAGCFSIHRNDSEYFLEDEEILLPKSLNKKHVYFRLLRDVYKNQDEWIRAFSTRRW